MTQKGNEGHGMTDDNITLGEVGRAVRRLESAVSHLSDQMTVALGPIGELRVHVDNAKQDINELAAAVRENKTRTETIEIRAAGVAGGITAIAFLLKFLLGK